MSESTTRKHLEAALGILSEVLDQADRNQPDFARWWAVFSAGNEYLKSARPGVPELSDGDPPRPLPAPTWAEMPWNIDRGQIRDRHGWSIASCAYSLGDDQDHATGRLILAAPALALAAGALLHRIDAMSTWAFARGAERPERERPRQVLADIWALPVEEL